MKASIAVLMLFVSMIAPPVFGQAQQGQVFEGSCYQDAYLPTYACDGASNALFPTRNCATQEAFTNCRIAGGTNCVLVGRRFLGWSSLANGDLNRVGYRRCQVIVYVRDAH